VESFTSSKLFTTRQGTILLGVIAAIIAAVALIVYLNHYRNSVKGNPTVSVLVAQKLIQKGTPGDVIRQTTGYYTATNVAKDQVQTGAITDPATLSGQVALTDISPSQQLTAADFGATSTSVAYSLPPNMRAVVVPLGTPQTVGAQIGAGSHVDVWVAFNGKNRLYYQNMYVLGLSGGNVTLRATPKQAGTLIYASQNAQMWLVLRPTLGTIEKRPPVIGIGNLATGH
jgi:Flp pilus assembly protein CpaB